MPFSRIRRVLTSSSTNSEQSNTSDSSNLSTTNTSRTSIILSTSPRDISYFDLPILSRSPVTYNSAPRDVFPDTPFEPSSFTPSPHIRASTERSQPQLMKVAPSPPACKKEKAKEHRRSRTSTLLSLLRRERPHPAERLLKPADEETVAMLESWGGFGGNTRYSGSSDYSRANVEIREVSPRSSFSC